MNDLTISTTLIKETHRRIVEEAIPRIKICLDQLNESEIWHKPNQNSNSIGNIVLHVCGNARQWIIHGLAGQQDMRDRSSEFDTTGPISTDILVVTLDTLIIDLEKALDHISTTDLLAIHTIQQYWTESGVSILVHAIEHFSYHTGQITFYTKLLKDIDTGYYAHLDL